MIVGWLQMIAFELLLWGTGLLMWSAYRVKAIEHAALRERSYKKAMAEAAVAQKRVAVHVWRSCGMLALSVALFATASFL